jgi:4'-phosphopantetheinyl transferase
LHGPTADWPLPAEAPTLARGEVHVWRAWLDLAPEQASRLAAILDEDERERAARFRLEGHRQRFVAAHGALRSILALYLGCPAASLRFGHGPRGKPLILDPGDSPDLRFNLAHSGDLAVCALAQGAEVGADVEAIRSLPDSDAIVARFFSAREQAMLWELSPGEREESFFLGWTRKEAYLKALGDGLARPLSGFSVTVRPGEPARLLEVEGQPHEVERWSLVALHPATGYAAALAVEGPLRRVVQWSWQPGLGAGNG